MRILIVEDDPKLAEVMRRWFVEAQHAVDVAHNGLAGRALALDGEYDVIVLDLRLPGLDGYELCRQVRTSGVTVPILACSAHNDADECVDSLEAGADDYLAKPFALEELHARVRALGRWSRRSGQDSVPHVRTQSPEVPLVREAKQADDTLVLKHMDREHPDTCPSEAPSAEHGQVLKHDLSRPGLGARMRAAWQRSLHRASADNARTRE